MEQVKGVKLATTMTHLRIVCFHFFRCINPKIIIQTKTGKYDIRNINNKYQLLNRYISEYFVSKRVVHRRYTGSSNTQTNDT